MPLNEILIRKIQHEGPLSFHDFMEMALYHPEEGYYTSTQECIGKNGDYYTTPEFSAVFGILMGRQLEEMWKLLDKKPFTIIEYGAGPGTLCHDILLYLSKNPELYEQLRYCIIEKSPAMVVKEKALLCEKAEWYDCIEDISFSTGCILSNEVLDNFAIHEVVMQKELMEVYVDYCNGFTELLVPASPELKDYLDELNVVLPVGYRTEINMEAIQWLKKNADALQKGFIMTIDYGFAANEFYHLSRCKGNLACYHRHHTNDSLYDAVGEQDITAHVNFSALQHWGSRYGLTCCGFTSQAHFLHGLGLVPLLDDITRYDPSKNNMITQLYRHIMRMSNQFNILIQQKGLRNVQLSGLQFAKSYV